MCVTLKSVAAYSNPVR